MGSPMTTTAGTLASPRGVRMDSSVRRAWESSDPFAINTTSLASSATPSSDGATVRHSSGDCCSASATPGGRYALPTINRRTDASRPKALDDPAGRGGAGFTMGVVRERQGPPTPNMDPSANYPTCRSFAQDAATMHEPPPRPHTDQRELQRPMHAAATHACRVRVGKRITPGRAAVAESGRRPATAHR